ncbi:MAG: phosphoribosylformylglycinamidine cyclo-ligase [Acidimicrobiia bacterium]|nr:phosphoribosylformylglycinamidine cyclo-ligase [Acidimicrobiia bacterium]
MAAGEALIERIKGMVGSTARPEVLGGIGGFAGLFALGGGRRDPVLVSSADGVGTKSLVAAATGRLDTIGIDLVAMCVDDLVCTGAEPLFLLDYVAVGRLEPEAVAAIVSGVAEGCRRAGCALLGGETAEHPGALAVGHFDLAGFAVGIVERDRILTGEAARPNDVLVGLPSPGLRSNGYSLARRVLLERAGRHLDDPAWPGAPRSLADELLEPSVVYAPAVLALLREVDVRALAHVTGGGLAANLARVLPAGVLADVDRRTWEPPRIFGEIQRLGEVDAEEMARVFNLGIGMVAVVPAAEVSRALDVLSGEGVRAMVIGEVQERR